MKDTYEYIRAPTVERYSYQRPRETKRRLRIRWKTLRFDYGTFEHNSGCAPSHNPEARFGYAEHDRFAARLCEFASGAEHQERDFFYILARAEVDCERIFRTIETLVVSFSIQAMQMSR